MRLKRCFWLTAITVLFTCAAYSAFAQVVPAATEKRQILAAGAGLSDYNPDWDQGRLYGGTAWLDYTPNWVPSVLQGIGLEAEGRDLNYGRSSASPNLREDTIEGGVIYAWPHFRNLRPYGKFLAGYGNRDAEGYNQLRYHDSRTILAAGGGLDYRVYRNVWVRADYEYQHWPDMHFKDLNNVVTPIGPMHPNGFTLGALYHFGSRQSTPSAY
jgi:opacity protein-like surface antigen